MPTKLPCATGILLSLIVLLIVVAVPSSSLQVDEIWLSKTSDESLEIAYLVTSYTPEATDALLASFAKLHFTQFQTPEDNFFFRAKNRSSVCGRTKAFILKMMA
jgi:hypothetical protein